MSKFKTLTRILTSRFRQEKNEEWVKERRETCKECPYNTKNLQDISRRQKIANFISKLYTLITLSENEDLGECSICTCPLFYKTREKDEECEDNRWKSIYIPNNRK